jgi:hypothetical protein
MGKIGGKVKPVRSYAEMKYVYEIDPANGDSVIIETAIFPSGKYDALDFIPNWHGHRFVGWFKNAASPSASIPSMSGEITADTPVIYVLKTIYAHWQLPVTIMFDATSNGGVLPEGWAAPYYYAGQPFGSLPKPTHETLNFVGWYDGNGNKITAASIVPDGGASFTARFASTSFEVDLNNEWRLSEDQSNPDPALYAGVYESFSNHGVDNNFAKMYIRLVGYTNFRIYIRSYAESNYDYTIAFNPDVDVVSLPSNTTTGVKAHTRGNQKSGQDLSSYTPVDYELDGGEHFIVVVYRKDSSAESGNDRGYVLVPYDQGGAA